MNCDLKNKFAGPTQRCSVGEMLSNLLSNLPLFLMIGLISACHRVKIESCCCYIFCRFDGDTLGLLFRLFYGVYLEAYWILLLLLRTRGRPGARSTSPICWADRLMRGLCGLLSRYCRSKAKLSTLN